MNELLTLAIAPGILWAFFVFLRVPATTLILSMLVGKLFSEELGQKLYEMNTVVVVHDIRQVQLALLLLPIVLSVILTRSRVSKSKMPANTILLAFTSASLVLFALPYVDLSSKLTQNGKDIIDAYQAYIVCATGGLALLFSWSPDLRVGRHRHK